MAQDTINANLNISFAGGGGGGAAGAPGAVGGGGAAPIDKETTALKENHKQSRIAVLEKKKHAQASQLQAQKMQGLNAGLLGVNMSLLGVSFGYMNLLAMKNINRDADLQELQLKEKKTEADKKRIKEIKKEMIEEEKLSKVILGTISAFQILASFTQIGIALRSIRIGQSAQVQGADAAEARSSLMLAKAKGVETTGIIGAETAKAGPLSPLMAAIIIGAVAAVVIGVTAAMAGGVKIPGAATGDVARAGDPKIRIFGEGGQDELITPVPLMRQVIREEVRGPGRGGGAGVYIENLNAIDTQSFNEAYTAGREEIDLGGFQ